MPKGIYKRTKQVWNKYLKGKGICKPNSGSFKKGIPNNVGINNQMFGILGEKHHLWRGENVSYVSKHKWVYKFKGRPKICEHCGKTCEETKLNWANKNHKYKRDVNEYFSLCIFCHRQYDIKINKSYYGNRTKKTNSNITSL